MFFQSLLVSALATVTIAQSTVLTFTRVPNPVTVGQAQAITYATNDTSSPVTIILRKGPSTDLRTVATLTTSATGGQYVWTPAASLENGIDYALQITQGSQLNYFGPFQVQGSTGSGSSSSSSASSSSSSATGSSSSVTSAATYPAGNATHTMTGTASAGTGTTMSRNATMSSPSLTSSSSTTSGPASSTNSDLQAAPTQSPGAAANLMAGGSAIALVLGAVGAIVMG